MQLLNIAEPREYTERKKRRRIHEEKLRMYAETSLMFPYLQSMHHQQVHQLDDDFSSSLKHNDALASAVSDYDLGAEGDLFKAPEPILEEPVITIDPMTAAFTMISCGGEVIGTQEELKVPDIGSSIDNGQLLSEIFYECKKDILANEATRAPLSAVMDVNFPLAALDETLISEDNVFCQGQFQKSVSSECLSSMHRVPGTSAAPNFLDFQNIDVEADYRLRRAFSEGDIKTLGNGNINIIPSVTTQHIITSCTPEVRKEKLLRYKNKRTRRNFGRKIKYACRKALADSQPRIRGRFARTEENDVVKKP